VHISTGRVHCKKKRPFLPVSHKLTNEENLYNVYPLQGESPCHGMRSIVDNPAEINASPCGWHDTNGLPAWNLQKPKELMSKPERILMEIKIPWVR
jgi:hypothetical protein